MLHPVSVVGLVVSFFITSLLYRVVATRVVRDPSLIVPPICKGLISGINTTTGLVVSASNSALVASARPSTLIACSMTITCIPRHIPRVGTLFSRANRVAAIIPSIPRTPKPPGIKTPLVLSARSTAHAAACFSGLLSLVASSRSPASTQRTLTLTFKCMDACDRALTTDKYASSKPVYFPTSAISTLRVKLSTVCARLDHDSRSGVGCMLVSPSTFLIIP
mmetsp:Transcript_5559/g.11288  ORF Transcript_5559/g.11288 Transcript_5559/m.11288 type:complete len:221 (-) Transcript_5559:864-1526(-)